MEFPKNRHLNLSFSIYINDIANATQSVPRLFADDTCLLVNHQNLQTLQSKIISELTIRHVVISWISQEYTKIQHIYLNSELFDIINWCKANKLTKNPFKCDAIVICPQINKTVSAKDFEIKLNNSIIDISNKARYLGILIDSKLNFKDHLNEMELKISRVVGIMHKLKSVLSQEAPLKLH